MIECAAWQSPLAFCWPSSLGIMEMPRVLYRDIEWKPIASMTGMEADITEVMCRRTTVTGLVPPEHMGSIAEAFPHMAAGRMAMARGANTTLTHTKFPEAECTTADCKAGDF